MDHPPSPTTDMEGDASSSFPTTLDPKDGILHPEPNDIICGRGKSIAHKGNARFRQLINEKKDEYQAARRREDKTRLTMEIVHELRQSSRFLLKDPKLQLWFEVGQEYMKEKGKSSRLLVQFSQCWHSFIWCHSFFVPPQSPML